MKVGADEVCISCPFCQMMLTDGFTDKGVENAKVMDIAEVLAEGL
jgi:Fe-S oxidoreductase